jgi:hypothetical protein
VSVGRNGPVTAVLSINFCIEKQNRTFAENVETMFKIGDKVKFLNAVGGGKVIGYVSPKVVTVEDEEGFEVPVLITELVRDVPMGNVPSRGRSKEHKPVKEEVRQPKKESLPLFASSAGKPATTTPSFFLAFVPEVPTLPLSGEIKAWLVNDSPNTVLFHFSLLAEGTYVSEKSGRLAPYSRIPLKGFSHSDLSSFPDFGLQLLPFGARSSALLPALEKTIRVNPVKFYKETSFTGNSYFETRAFLISLKDAGLSNELEKLKSHDFSAPKVAAESGDIRKPIPPKREPIEIKEVDLHILELVDNTEGLSPGELIEIQMGRFRIEMENAIRNGTRRVVFIHGVGQGTLKNELRRELASRYKKYDFQDASFREYGYGATVVILKR